MVKWDYEKTKSHGRVDETWKKENYAVNIHKARTKWMVTLYRDNDVSDLFFKRKSDVLEFITMYKLIPREIWKDIDKGVMV